MAILLGALGTLFTLGLLGAGFAGGWVAHARLTKQATVDPAPAHELQRLQEEQEAFAMLQNYTMEQAYGIHKPVEGGDSQ